MSLKNSSKTKTYPKTSGLFQIIDSLYTKDPLPDGMEVAGSLWMVNRFLSMERILTDVIAQTARYTNALGAQYYDLLKRIIPKTKPPRNRYLKGEYEFSKELVGRYAKAWNYSWKDTMEAFKVLLMTHTEEDLHKFVGLEFKPKEKKNENKSK